MWFELRGSGLGGWMVVLRVRRMRGRRMSLELQFCITLEADQKLADNSKKNVILTDWVRAVRRLHRLKVCTHITATYDSRGIE